MNETKQFYRILRDFGFHAPFFRLHLAMPTKLISVCAAAALLVCASLCQSQEIINDQKQLLINEQLRLAEGLQSRGNCDLAIKEYQSLIKHFPDDALVAEAWSRLGDTFAAAGKIDEALECYTSFLAKFPSSPIIPAVKINLARAQSQKGGPENLAKAVASLNEITGSSGGVSEEVKEYAAYCLAGVLKGTGEKAKALELYASLASKPFTAERPSRAFAALELAAAEKSQGQFDGAIARYQSVADSAGAPPEAVNSALQFLAAAYVEKNEHAMAADAYGRLAVLFPDTKSGEEALYSRLECLYHAKEYNKLIEETDSVLKNTGATANIDVDRLNFLRACALQTQGFHAGALTYFSKIVDNGKETDAFRQSAIQSVACLMTIGKEKEAVAAATKYLADPRLACADKLKIVGLVADKITDSTLAVPLWEMATGQKETPQLAARGRYELGAAKLRAGDLAEAKKCFEMVMAGGAPGLAPYALMGLADILSASGDAEGAGTSLNRLLTDYPDSPLAPDALFRLAESLLRCGKEEMAAERLSDLKIRFKGHPLWGRSVLLLGLIDYGRGDMDAAETCLDLALREGSLSDSERIEAMACLAWTMAGKGDEKGALELLQPVLKSPRLLSAAQPNVIARLGDFFIKVKRPDMGRECFSKLLEDKDKSIKQKALIGFGRACLDLDQLDDAIARLKEAADLAADPAQTSTALAELGTALVKKGRKDEAVLMFEKCLENPADKTAASNARLGLARIFADSPDRLATANRYAMAVFILSDDPAICPEAMLLSIELSLAQDRMDEAKGTWNELVRRFPAASKKPKAQELTVKLKARESAMQKK